ncbi:unnamed protein product [Pylaiella littoralis]
MAKGKSTALQGMAADAMRDNPQLTGVALKRELERTGLKVTDRTATRLKNNAKKAHHAAVAGSYQQLPSLCAQLEKNSPGTVAEVEKNADGTFKRLFVMLGRAAHACAQSPLKFICVDAGHLKGSWKGQMLLVTCKDANNTLVQVATVICDKEDNSNYV